MAKILFNFLITPQSKRRFEAVCASNGLSMSCVLNGLVDAYVIDHAENIEHRAAKFQRLDAAIEVTQAHWNHRQSRIEPDFDDGPASPIYHDGSDFYDNNF